MHQNEPNEFARAFLTEEEMRGFYPSRRIEPKVNSNGRNHQFRKLRQENALSLNEAAARIGLSKTALERLENKSWNALTVKELDLLAGVFEISGEELLYRLKFGSAGSNGCGARSSPRNPFFVSEILEGIRVEAYVRRPQDFFIGTLIIPPQKTLPSEHAPQADFVFYGVLKGQLLLTVPGKEHVLKRGSRFSFDDGMPYELYNSHQFRDAVLVLHTSPSFI